MLYKKIGFFLLLFFFLVLQSCSDDPSSIGAELVQRDLPVISIFDSDTAYQYSGSYEETFNLASAGNILVGKAQNVEAVTLINFILNLPDSIVTDLENNSISLNSVKLQLIRNYTFGNSSEPFDLSIHKINSVWSSTRFNKDSLPVLNYEEQNLNTGSSILEDSVYTFELDNNFVFNWLTGNADSLLLFNGLLLKPTAETNKVLGFQALVSTFINLPSILLEFEKNGVSDTLNLIPLADISVVTGTIPSVDTESIVIQSGLTINSHLFFDISEIPSDAIVTDAQLFLTFNPEASFRGTDKDSSLAVYFLKDSTQLDSLNQGSISITKNGNIFTGNIASFVQRWVNGESNEGVVLTTGNLFNTVDLFVLRGSNAAPGQKPKLKVYYTIMK